MKKLYISAFISFVFSFGLFPLLVQARPDSDANAFTVAITSPASGATVQSSVSITANVTADNTVTKVEFFVDNFLKGTVTATPYSYVWDTRTHSNGSHTIKVKATDAVNQTAEATATVTVSNYSLAITAPLAGATVNGVVNVSANVTTSDHISKVSFLVDEVKKEESTQKTNTYSFNWDSTTGTNASHTLKIVVDYDDTHASSSATVTVTVANPTEFTLTIAADTGGTTDPAPGSYKYNTGNDATVTASANVGYTFDKWTGSAVPPGKDKDNPIVFRMNANKILTANFVIFKIDLSGAIVVFVDQNNKLRKINASGVISNVINTDPDVKLVQFDPNANLYIVFNEKQPVPAAGGFEAVGAALTSFIMIKVNPKTNAVVGVDSSLTNLVWNPDSVSPNVQFDGSGKIYYLAQKTDGKIVLRRYTSETNITELINENIKVGHWLVRTDGTVVIAGETLSTKTKWLRKMAPGGALSYIATPADVGWVLEFPDGRVYAGLPESLPFQGVYKLPTDLGYMDNTAAGAPYIGFTKTGFTPTYDVTTLATGINATYAKGFTDTAGVYLLGYGKTAGNDLIGLTGTGQYRTVLYYHPTPKLIKLSLVDRITLLKESLGELLIPGTKAGVNKLILYSLTSKIETNILFENIEIYHLDVLSNGSILFDGLDFDQNKYVVGMFERAAGGALRAGDVRTLYGYKELCSLSGKPLDFQTITTTDPNALTISGTVKVGETALENVVMSGLPEMVKTNASGQYSGTVDSGWTGTVTPTLAGYTFDPTSRSYTGVTSNQTQNYAATLLPTCTISGTVKVGETALENVVMSGLPGTVKTNASGQYSGTVYSGWTGTVTPTLAGYTFDPSSKSYTGTGVTSDQIQNYAATLLTYTISGTVKVGETALENVVMSGLPGTVKTNASGQYSGTVNYGWTGTVTPTLAGYTFDPANKAYTSVTSNQTQNYTATLLTYTISGTVKVGETALENVVMSGLPGTVKTNASGQYSGTVDYGWTGTVTPTLAGYTFAPTNKSYTGVTSNQTSQDYAATLIPPPQIALSKTKLNFGATNGETSSSAQKVVASNSGGGVLNWSVVSNASWLSCSPSSGTGTGVIQISVNPAGQAVGTQTGTITISDPNATNNPRTISVALTIKAAGTGTVPFGDFATPIDGTQNINGAIPVTGWVLDDVETTKVEIWRDPVAGEGTGIVFIGDAIFVEGARPDVEAAYPTYPLNSRAGWGYMLLTNFLPGQGNGIFKIYAWATDKEGNTVSLGTRTITCDNTHAVKPFGTIDTPMQGGDVSGNLFVNFGWVLTPMPKTVPKDGSTIEVYVDGARLGNLATAPNVYNQYRVDVATSFPGLNNTSGPVGAFYLDTTKYPNGVHTIYWIATDDAGAADGIGSRYFNIVNTGTSANELSHCEPLGVAIRLEESSRSLRGISSTHATLEDILNLPLSFDPLGIKRGFNLTAPPEMIVPDNFGNVRVEMREVERLEISLNPAQADQAGNMMAGSGRLERDNPPSPPFRKGGVEAMCVRKEGEEAKYAGYMIVGSELRLLPIGSTLNPTKGTFSWMPGPGFLGTYDLLFLQTDGFGITRKIPIKVTIRPKFEKH